MIKYELEWDLDDAEAKLLQREYESAREVAVRTMQQRLRSHLHDGAGGGPRVNYLLAVPS